MQAEGLPGIIDLTEYYVGEIQDGQFYCLHGPSECQGDTILACAYNLTASTTHLGWWKMSVCMQANGAYQNIPSNAESCAKKAGLDWSSISNCANGNLGHTLMGNSLKYSNSRGVDETPTTSINGKLYVGGANNPLETICKAYTGTPPAGCNSVLSKL